MLYRNDQVDKAMTDGDWPHQVELPVYRCMGHNYRTMHFFCQELSLSPRTHPYRRDSADMTVFCFAEREHAKQFHARSTQQDHGDANSSRREARRVK